MPTDFTALHLVHTLPGAADIAVERDHTYATAAGDLAFELYRPHGSTLAVPTAAVVFVAGFPEPPADWPVRKPMKEWTSYVEWARLVAASGVAAITYAKREVADVAALLRHLRANAAQLGLDPARIGVWACSGHGPTALGVLAHDRPAFAALLYPFAIDVDGATTVADAAKLMYFTVPPIGIADLPRDIPLLVVRAGADTTPGLDAALRPFLAAARTRGLALEVIEHATAPHAFDTLDDSPRSREVIAEVLAFIQRAAQRTSVHGSCHCGAVTLEVARAPTAVTSCNCSICRRLGTLWAYYTPAEVRVAGATATYQWGDKSIDFHRCATCGCATHWAPRPGRDEIDRMGINGRLLAPEVLGAARVRRLDGASEDWKYLDD